jgi:hypothetical protein
MLPRRLVNTLACKPAVCAVLQVKQLFERFSAASPAAAGDARFQFFMRSVWPRVKESVSRGETHGGIECGCLKWWE